MNATMTDREPRDDGVLACEVSDNAGGCGERDTAGACGQFDGADRGLSGLLLHQRLAPSATGSSRGRASFANALAAKRKTA